MGMSHRTAPVSLLEKTAVPADDLAKTLDELHRAETISEVLLLSNGRVAARGTPEQVIRPEVLAPVYNCPLDVRRSNGRFYIEVHPRAWEGLLPG